MTDKQPTQEQVIAWAEECGVHPHRIYGGLVVHHSNGGWVSIENLLARFAAIAYEAGRKDENEACAKVAEQIERDIFNAVGDPRVSEFKPKITAAIRARREQ